MGKKSLVSATSLAVGQLKRVYVGGGVGGAFPPSLAIVL